MAETLSRRERGHTRRYLRALDKAHTNRHNITVQWPGASRRDAMLVSALLSSEKLGQLIEAQRRELEAF